MGRCPANNECDRNTYKLWYYGLHQHSVADTFDSYYRCGWYGDQSIRIGAFNFIFEVLVVSSHTQDPYISSEIAGQGQKEFGEKETGVCVSVSLFVWMCVSLSLYLWVCVY